MAPGIWPTTTEVRSHASLKGHTPYGATKRPRLVWLLAGRPLMARVASPTCASRIPNSLAESRIEATLRGA